MSTDSSKANGGASVIRQEFGVTQAEIVRETAATAVAEREKAVVQARYIMALQRPRNIEKCRQELLKACSYPDFARAAWFDLRSASKGEGFTIRFAEEALRAFGNVYPEMAIVFESDDTRIMRITVTDMEANVPYSTEIVIKKRIEKTSLKKDQVAISERLNSKGQKVFLVEATDEEVLKTTNALKSRAMRTDGLRLIPAWLKEECKRAIQDSSKADIAKDPAAAKRAIIDGFNGIGVSVDALEQYLGSKVETLTEKEIVHLRSLYTAIKDGEISWAEAMEIKREAEERREPTHDERNGSTAKAAKVAEEKLKQQSGPADGGDQEPIKDSDPNPEPKGTTKGFNFGGGKK